MNQMVEKLKALFAEEAARSEKLRAESYQDSLTGLANRRLLDEQLGDQLLLNEQSGDGYLLMLRVNDLSGLNQRLGGQRTDALIKSIGDLLKRISAQSDRRHWLAARNRGGEFSLLTPGLDSRGAERLAMEISATLENLRLTGASDCTPVAHLGIVAYQPGNPLSSVWLRLTRRWRKPSSTPSAPGRCCRISPPAPASRSMTGAPGSTTP